MDSTTVASLVGTGFANIVSDPMLAQTLRSMCGLLTVLLNIENDRAFSPEMLFFTTERTFIEYPLLFLPLTHLFLQPIED